MEGNLQTINLALAILLTAPLAISIAVGFAVNNGERNFRYGNPMQKNVYSMFHFIPRFVYKVPLLAIIITAMIVWFEFHHSPVFKYDWKFWFVMVGLCINWSCARFFRKLYRYD